MWIKFNHIYIYIYKFALEKEMGKIVILTRYGWILAGKRQSWKVEFETLRFRSLESNGFWSPEIASFIEIIMENSLMLKFVKQVMKKIIP